MTILRYERAEDLHEFSRVHVLCSDDSGDQFFRCYLPQITGRTRCLFAGGILLDSDHVAGGYGGKVVQAQNTQEQSVTPSLSIGVSEITVTLPFSRGSMTNVLPVISAT